MAEEGEEVPQETPEVNENLVAETGLELTFPVAWVTAWYKSESPSWDVAQLKDLQPAKSFHDEVLQDFHAYNLTHAKSICLTPRQAAIFCTIMESVMGIWVAAAASFHDPSLNPGHAFQAAASNGSWERLNLLDNKKSSSDPSNPLYNITSWGSAAVGLNAAASPAPAFSAFKAQVLAHATAGIFTSKEAHLLIDFVSLTFFRHYLLYQACLANEQRCTAQAGGSSGSDAKPADSDGGAEGEEAAAAAGAEGGEGGEGQEQAGGSSSSTGPAAANRNFLKMKVQQNVEIDQPNLYFFGTSMDLNLAVNVTEERDEAERNRPKEADREPMVVRDSDPFKLTKENSMERLMIDPVMQQALEVKILDASARVDAKLSTLKQKILNPPTTEDGGDA